MKRCQHCGIQIGLEPFVRDGVSYCCKRCLRRTRRIESSLVERGAAYL